MSSLTDDILQQLIDFLYKKDTREKVNLYFLDPAAKYVTSYLKPYLIALILTLIFIMILLLRILYLLQISTSTLKVIWIVIIVIIVIILARTMRMIFFNAFSNCAELQCIMAIAIRETLWSKDSDNSRIIGVQLLPNHSTRDKTLSQFSFLPFSFSFFFHCRHCCHCCHCCHWDDIFLCIFHLRKIAIQNGKRNRWNTLIHKDSDNSRTIGVQLLPNHSSRDKTPLFPSSFQFSFWFVK